MTATPTAFAPRRSRPMPRAGASRLRHGAWACALGLTVAMLCTPASANLLVNSSFEDPGAALGSYHALGPGSTFITGWTTFLSGVEYYSAGAAAADGVMVVDLANYTYNDGGIAQSFATQAGQAYVLSFSAGNVQASGRTGDGQVRVEIAGLDQTFDTATANSAAYAWQRIDVPFVALADITTLRLSNTQNSLTHFALVDAIGVVAAPVPEPASAALWLAGLGALGLLRRRAGPHPV